MVDHQDGLHCSHGALTDAFGWLIQGILACLAFTCLIAKRFCEPRRERRPWIIWFYDTSKQGLGALVIHFANVFLAEFFQGDPCTWYIVSFLLDSSVGLLMIFIGIRLTQRIARRKGWPLLVFGEYGKPPQISAWLAQCAAYVSLMLIEKILITLLIQLKFWDKVRDFIMSPIKDPKVEVAIVVLVIPFFINAMMFWVVDNFLMQKHGRWKDDVPNTKPKVLYSNTDHMNDSECVWYSVSAYLQIRFPQVMVLTRLSIGRKHFTCTSRTFLSLYSKTFIMNDVHFCVIQKLVDYYELQSGTHNDKSRLN